MPLCEDTAQTGKPKIKNQNNYPLTITANLTLFHNTFNYDQTGTFISVTSSIAAIYLR